jgi:hypothetical protein
MTNTREKQFKKREAHGVTKSQLMINQLHHFHPKVRQERVAEPAHFIMPGKGEWDRKGQGQNTLQGHVPTG